MPRAWVGALFCVLSAQGCSTCILLPFFPDKPARRMLFDGLLGHGIWRGMKRSCGSPRGAWTCQTSPTFEQVQALNPGRAGKRGTFGNQAVSSQSLGEPGWGSCKCSEPGKNHPVLGWFLPRLDLPLMTTEARLVCRQYLGHSSIL